jgi:outer membrane lipoprotein carrier protein
MRRLVRYALWLAMVAAVPAQAALPAALQTFIAGLTTFSAEFEQHVRDAGGHDVAAGRGTLAVQRPGRFRWEYRPVAPTNGIADGGQLLLADGRNLWLYERDLAQATVRDAGSTESAAPMLLLSGDPAQIEAAFTLTAEPDHDGLRWVAVQPRAAAADFARAELAFRGADLVRMIISDKIGQLTTLIITRSQRNPRLDPGLFRFTPPAGVDVIGTARP